MNNFDKTVVLAFSNSFLKIELSCDKENMFKYISNTFSFQKKMLSTLITKIFVKHAEIYP